MSELTKGSASPSQGDLAAAPSMVLPPAHPPCVLALLLLWRSAPSHPWLQIQVIRIKHHGSQWHPLPMAKLAAERQLPRHGGRAFGIAAGRRQGLGCNPLSGVSHSPLRPLSQPGLFNTPVSLDWQINPHCLGTGIGQTRQLELPKKPRMGVNRRLKLPEIIISWDSSAPACSASKCVWGVR